MQVALGADTTSRWTTVGQFVQFVFGVPSGRKPDSIDGGVRCRAPASAGANRWGRLPGERTREGRRTGLVIHVVSVAGAADRAFGEPWILLPQLGQAVGDHRNIDWVRLRQLP